MDDPVQAAPSDSEQDEGTDFDEDDELEPGSPHENGSQSDGKKTTQEKEGMAFFDLVSATPHRYSARSPSL